MATMDISSNLSVKNFKTFSGNTVSNQENLASPIAIGTQADGFYSLVAGYTYLYKGSASTGN
jgi:hypothetical protein